MAPTGSWSKVMAGRKGRRDELAQLPVMTLSWCLLMNQKSRWHHLVTVIRELTFMSKA